MDYWNRRRNWVRIIEKELRFKGLQRGMNKVRTKAREKVNERRDDENECRDIEDRKRAGR